MVSDSELVTRLRQILRTSDLHTATVSTVRSQLEQEFQVDLSDRKAFLRDQIDIFLQTVDKDLELQRNNQNAVVQGDEEEEEENDTAKAEKEVKLSALEGEDSHDSVSGDAKKPEEGEGEGEEEEEEEEEGEEEKNNEQASKQKRSKNVDNEVKKRGGGFNKLCSLSPELQTLCGVPELARTGVVKKIWAYIRENSLQDPKDKRKIICDESLQALFRVNSINMFKMNKALTKHIWPLSSENENVEQKIEGEDSHDSVSGDAKKPVEEEGEEEEEEEVEEEEEEEEKNNEQGSKQKRSTKVDKDVKKRGGGFTKLCSLSPQLQTLLGVSELARTEVVKKLWIYIRENNLQDPKDKRNIICDESLHALFRVNSINMFKMNKSLSRHIWPLDEEAAKSTPKGKRCKQVGEGADEPEQKEKRQKKGSSGFLAPLSLSDALVKFFGTGENALSRADVVKRMWEYIKQNDLQDPSDKRRIICDDKLKELFEVDSFQGFSVTKLLTAHFVKKKWKHKMWPYGKQVQYTMWPLLGLKFDKAFIS